jgi:hypothetical protein
MVEPQFYNSESVIILEVTVMDVAVLEAEDEEMTHET